jgi:NADH-quinone oxidoreductase subunit N
LLLIYGVFISTSPKLGHPLTSLNIGWLSLQIVLFALFILLLLPQFILFSWSQLLVNNFFVFGGKLILLTSFIFWALLSFPYISNEQLNSFEYWILSILALVGMLFIVQAHDLLSMYLAVEFQSLVFYVLASFKRTSEFSTESGLKYFILGAFSSALLLFGSSILYGLTGLTNFSDYTKLFAGLLINDQLFTLGVTLSLIFINVSLLFKLSAAPFHMWSPDVYEGAPTSVTAFFAILSKLAILSLLFKFCFFAFHDFVDSWYKVISCCAYLSILIGTLGAFSQKKWKRFIAYSSINHVGFLLIGFSTGELEGLFSLIFYIVIYIIMMFGIFLFVLSLRYYQYPTHFQIRYIKDLTSLFLYNPVLAFTLTLILFSMAGIPPLIGFFSKIFILLPGLQNNMYSLTIFAVLMSCIACFYYIRIIKTMYFDKLENWIVTYPVNKVSSMLLGLFTLLTTLLFLDLELFSLFITRMVLPFLG